MKRFIAACIMAVLLLMGMSGVSLNASEAYTVENLDITIHVQEDGRLLVSEAYDLNFNYYRSSFVRTITPTCHVPIQTVEGIVYRDYYFPITDVQCDRLLSITQNQDSLSVAMGDRDQTLTGRQSFTVSYTVQTTDLQLPEGTQMLYWTFVTSMDTTVEHLHYEIHMPKAFDPQEVFTSTGKYGDVKDTLSASVSGNVISGDLTQPLQANELATIKVNLPNTYFSFPQPLDVSLWASLVSIVLLLAVLFVFWRFGRDREVFVDVRSEPPKDLRSAEIGYVMNRYASDRDLMSLFIDWGIRGFIRIRDCGEHVELEKLREMNENNAKAYERELFATVFQSGDVVGEDALREARVSFSMEKAKRMLERSFTHERKRHVYTNSSLILQGLMVILTLIPSVLFIWLATFDTYYLWHFSARHLIVSLLLGIDLAAWVVLIRHRYALSERAFFARLAIAITAGCVLLALNAVILFLFDVQSWAIVVYLIVTIVLFFCMLYMDKRTRQGDEWRAQIMGICEFIESVEPKQLKQMQAEDHGLFERLLPYAYVLDLADIWAKKFKGIAVEKPSWYIGMEEYDHFDAFLFWHTFQYCFYYMRQNAVYRPPIREAHFLSLSGRILPKRNRS